MGFVKNIFWNFEEKRLRMIWRLIGQILILVILLILFQLIFVILIEAGEILQGQIESQPNAYIKNAIQLLISLTEDLIPGLALTISIWLAGRLFDHRAFYSFGFNINKEWWIDFGFGLGLGAGLMSIIFLVELVVGWIDIDGFFVTRDPNTPFLFGLLIPLITFLAVGFYEELFSRGYQLKNLAEGISGKLLSPRTAIILSTLFTSVLFGFLHRANPHASLSSTLNISLAGILLAVGYVLTGQLAIPIALHISWNFFQGNVFGFPVSGGGFRVATFIQTNQGGPDLWTGGLFGPEAGLLATMIMVFGILFTAFWVKKRTGKIDLYLPLCQPP